MMPHTDRLHAGDVDRVIRTGTQYSSPLFRIRMVRQPERQSIRLAVIVPKRVDKRAVVRNRCKRLIREAVRTGVSDTRSVFDIVLFVQQDISAMHMHEVRDRLLSVLHAAGIFRDDV